MQGYWSGLPFPSPGISLTQRSNLCFLHWQVYFLPSEPLGNPITCSRWLQIEHSPLNASDKHIPAQCPVGLSKCLECIHECLQQWFNFYSPRGQEQAAILTLPCSRNDWRSHIGGKEARTVLKKPHLWIFSLAEVKPSWGRENQRLNSAAVLMSEPVFSREAPLRKIGIVIGKKNMDISNLEPKRSGSSLQERWGWTPSAEAIVIHAKQQQAGDQGERTSLGKRPGWPGALRSTIRY